MEQLRALRQGCLTRSVLHVAGEKSNQSTVVLYRAVRVVLRRAACHWQYLAGLEQRVVFRRRHGGVGRVCSHRLGVAHHVERE